MPKDNVKRKPQKVKNLIARFDKGTAPHNMIYPSSGHIYRVACTKDINETVNFYDGLKLIFTVDKKKLYDNTQLELETHYGSKGISWVSPLYDLAVDIDYKIEHNLQADGDCDGIIIWIDGKALG